MGPYGSSHTFFGPIAVFLQNFSVECLADSYLCINTFNYDSGRKLLLMGHASLDSSRLARTLRWSKQIASDDSGGDA
jgi:hypothetical protein